jgi:PKD repeat protein
MKTRLIISIVFAGLSLFFLPESVNAQGDTCFVEFTYDQLDSYLFQFQSTAVPDSVNYLWDFGNGESSDNPNPLHDYTNPGVYEVCLNVFDSVSGCEAVYCDSLFVGPDTCQVNFMLEYFPEEQAYGFYPEVDGMPPYTYSWYIDGNPVSSDSVLLYQFSETGTHSVCIEAETATGCGAEYCEDVFVESLPCDVSYNLDVEGGLYVFTAISEGEEPFFYTWYLNSEPVGDSTQLELSFEEEGWYSVCIEAEDGNACLSEYCDSIYVELPDTCSASFEYNLEEFTGQFDATVSGETPITYHWTIDDMPVSNDDSLVYEFPVNGEYTICLSIETATGCADTYCETLNIDASNGSGYLLSGSVSPYQAGLDVSVDCYRGGTDTVFVSVMTSQGNFDFENLPARDYYLRAIPSDGNFNPTWFGNTTLDSEAEKISLNGNTWDVDIMLQTTAVKMALSQNVFSVYPNPFSEWLVLENNSSRSILYRLTDARGQLMREGICSKISRLNTSELNSGVYILEIKTSGRTFHQKIIHK